MAWCLVKAQGQLCLYFTVRRISVEAERHPQGMFSTMNKKQMETKHKSDFNVKVLTVV
jgi:hypothetical protein